VTNEIDANRRCFLGAAVMTIADAQLGTSCEVVGHEPRDLAAFKRAMAPRIAFGLVCAALIPHLRPEAPPFTNR
jgi:hypothetical protein